jgi:hypothetical protein
MLMLERLLEYMSSFDDAWFATMSEVYECWEDGDDAEGVAGDAQAATAGR